MSVRKYLLATALLLPPGTLSARVAAEYRGELKTEPDAQTVKAAETLAKAYLNDHRRLMEIKGKCHAVIKAVAQGAEKKTAVLVMEEQDRKALLVVDPERGTVVAYSGITVATDGRIEEFDGANPSVFSDDPHGDVIAAARDRAGAAVKRMNEALLKEQAKVVRQP